ncbi:MAG: hypothetical protein MRY21_07020 [Simkaniaceae bacterium]|nr:hypothetical protein [Simkaniaceae bacterium]
MKRLLMLLALPIAVIAAHKPPTIKLLIGKEKEAAVVEVKGSYTVMNPLTNKKIDSSFSSRRFSLMPTEDGIRWGADYPGVYQIQIVPNSCESTILIDGIEYRGLLEAYNIDNRLSIVNEADIESYIKSRLSKELATRTLERPVLEALAIIARTNAFHYARQENRPYFHLDESSGDYLGFASTLINLEIDRAVDATRSMIMLMQGKPFPCEWTENCAGKTIAYNTLHRQKVICPRGVGIPLAMKTREESYWKYSIEKEKLADLTEMNHITEVALYIDNVSKRAYALQVKSDKRSKNIDFLALQKALGSENIRSSDFSVSLDKGMVHFEGFGEGTGCGLCILTARELAKKGDGAAELLADFFPMTHLEKKESLFERPIVDLEDDE